MRCSLLLCFLVATTAAAQPGPWTPLGGPQAARLVGAAVSGDGTPYAVSDTETHRYNAGAARWEDVASTFTGAFSDVAGAPGGEAWAGTGGVFHIFADGTHEWRESPDDPNHEYVSALADGVDPRKVAAEIEELMLQPPRRGKR